MGAARGRGLAATRRGPRSGARSSARVRRRVERGAHERRVRAAAIGSLRLESAVRDRRPARAPLGRRRLRPGARPPAGLRGVRRPGGLPRPGGALARRSAGVGYDPVRDRLLVFGGSDGTTTYNDLWALSLAGAPQWTFLGSGGALVPPREEHVTVYDATHDRLVIFGGIDHEGHILSDGWAFPLAGSSAWSPLATRGPPPPPPQSDRK